MRTPLSLAIALFLAATGPAFAQYKVVDNCGNMSPWAVNVPNTQGLGTMDPNGVHCTTAGTGGTGGSGGTVTQGPGNAANPWTVTPAAGSTIGIGGASIPNFAAAQPVTQGAGNPANPWTFTPAAGATIAATQGAGNSANPWTVAPAAGAVFPGTATQGPGNASNPWTITPLVGSTIAATQGAGNPANPWAISWPGTAGLASGGGTSVGTMPFVNAYIVGAGSGGVGIGTLATPNITGYSKAGAAQADTGSTQGRFIDITTSSQLHADLSAGVGTVGQAFPAAGVALLANQGGNGSGIIQSTLSVPISISTAGTTQLVPFQSGQSIYVSGWDVMASGTGAIALEYGGGTTCTGPVLLTGNYPLTAQATAGRSAGLGTVFVIPAGKALCAVKSAAVGMNGSLSFAQF